MYKPNEKLVEKSLKEYGFVQFAIRLVFGIRARRRVSPGYFLADLNAMIAIIDDMRLMMVKQHFFKIRSSLNRKIRALSWKLLIRSTAKIDGFGQVMKIRCPGASKKSIKKELLTVSRG